MGKIPIASGQRICMLILIDYFTKWVEVETFHQVKDTKVNKLVWKDIMCRFGVSFEIMKDNGS